jgi:trk system potassium uptake protein TrkA
MEHSEISFVPLLIVIVLAFFVPVLLSRFRGLGIPIVVGEIIAGIIVGQSGLGLVEEGPVLGVLSALGFAYLMFLSGLEIDFGKVLSIQGDESKKGVHKATGNPILIGAVIFLLTIIVSTSVAFVMYNLGMVPDPWIIALLLSTTSLGVVVPVLKESGFSAGRYGQTLLVTALIADFVTILLISVYVLLRTQGLTAELLLILVLFAAFVAAHQAAILSQRHLPTERIFERLSSATTQIKLRGSFLLALVFIALAESLGVEIILGAFLAGVIVSFLSQGEGTFFREKLDAFGYGFFVPIFFIMVGVGFDLPALLSSRSALLLVPVLLGVAYLVKSGPALLFRLNHSWRETLAAGVLLSSRLSLIIAAAAIGLQLELITPAINSAIILIAIITVIVSPVVFNRLMQSAEPERETVVIVGCRPLGEQLSLRLRDHGLDTLFICDDDRRDQGSDGQVWTRATLVQALQAAKLDQAKAVVAIEQNDGDNLQVCRLARGVFGVANVIAWVQDPSRNASFRELGVRVMNPAYASVLIMESLVLNQHAFSISNDVDETQTVRDIKLQNSHYVGRRLDNITLPGAVAMLMIERSGDILVPDLETRLRANDTITLVGGEDDVDEAARLLAQRA